MGRTHVARHRQRVEGLVLVVGSAALAGSGLLASWDAAASASPEVVASGVALVDVSADPFPQAMAGLLPGGHVYRYLDVTNVGGAGDTYTGGVSVTGDLSGQLSVEAVSCSLPWTTSGDQSSCVGTTSSSLGAGTPTSGAALGIDHGRIGSGAGRAQHVRYTLALRATAAPGTTGRVDFTVSGSRIGGTGPSAS